MAEKLAALKQKGGGELKVVTIAQAVTSKNDFTIDVKSILPSKYGELTLSNFALTNVNQTYSGGEEASDYSKILTSYNPLTGILNCHKSKTYGGGYTFIIKFDVICFYT